MSAIRVWATISATLFVTFAGFVIAVPAMRSAGFDQRSGTVTSRPGGPLGIGLAMNLLILAGALWIYRWFTARPFADMGLRFGASDLEFAALVTMLTAALAYGTLRTVRTSGGDGPAPVARPEHQTSSTLRLLMALTLLAGGLQEEVVYRGMMVTLLRPWGWLLALLVSATLFTLVHFVTSRVTWRQAVNWFVGGISLFVVYVVSQSVLVAACVHVARNLANSFLLVTVPGVSFTVPARPLSERTRLIYYTVLSTLVTLLAVLWYARPAG